MDNNLPTTGGSAAFPRAIESDVSMNSQNNKTETSLDVSQRSNDQHINMTTQPMSPQSCNKETSKDSGSSVSSATELKKNVNAKVFGENSFDARKRNSIHGNMYQLKLLMLFLSRGVSHKYSFRLGTEVQEAYKFDDLVFEYDINGKRIYRFLQAKHKLNEYKKIGYDNLLSNYNGDECFYIVKYFFSYMGLKKSNCFSKGSIKDLTICTNINFDFYNLKQCGIRVEKIMEKDEILDFNNGQKISARYKFTNDFVYKLRPWLYGYYLARKIYFTDNDIREFVNLLVFAVNQPNEDELGHIIKQEMCHELDFVKAEHVYNKFFISMLNWYLGKEKGNFLSYEDGKEFIVQLNRSIMWFGVKDPVESFLGRSEFINNLHAILNTELETNVSSRFVCVSGPAGIGKSELVRKYISMYSLEYDNKILWVNAENYETLADSFRTLARDKLNISTINADVREKKLNSIVEDVYTSFGSSKCLFIFDNAEKYRSQNEFDNGIEPFLPCLAASLRETTNRVHVLITSRNQNWPKHVEVLLLKAFSESEATEFVENSLKLEDDDQIEDIRKLVYELQFLPLALQQAVTYLGLQHRKLQYVGFEFKISNYLKKFERNSIEYFDFLRDDENDSSKTIYSTWDNTLNAIRRAKNGVATCEILEMLSYFAPTKIHEKTFKAFIKDDVIFSAAYNLLKQHSIIEFRKKDIVLHGLLTKVIMMHLQDQNREQEILYKALNLFSTATLTGNIVQHALSVWDHSCKYDKLIDEFSSLPRNIIDMFLDNLRFEEAELLGIKVSKQLKALPSKSHATQLNLIAMTEYAALALSYRGKYELSAKYYEDAFEMQKRIFGPQSLQALKGENKFCKILIQLNQYDRALEICEKIIEIQSEPLGKDHLDTSDTLYNKATVLYHQGKIEDSLLILKEVLCTRESFLGKKHPDTLHVKSLIAVIFSDLGKFIEATELVQELSLQKAINYVHIPNEILKKYNVGIIYLRTGEFEKALAIFNDAYVSNNKIFGEDHPVSMMIQYKVGDALRAAGKLEEALIVLECLHEKQKKMFGSYNPDAIFTETSIGYILFDKKNFTEALKILQNSLEKCRSVLGQEHRATLIVIKCIAEILTQQIESDESYITPYISHMTKYRREILKIQKITFGEDHKEYLVTKYNITLALYNSRQYDEALTIYEEISSDEKNSTAPVSISTKLIILEILMLHNNFEKAFELAKEILLAQQVPENGHAETLEMEVALIGFLNRLDETYSFAKEQREVYHTVDNIITIKLIIIDILMSQKKFEESLELAEEILRSQEDVPGNIETLETKVAKIDIMHRTKQRESAVQHYQKMCDNIDDIIKTKFIIIRILILYKKYEQALKLAKEVLHAAETVFGTRNIMVLEAKVTIIRILWYQKKIYSAVKIYRELCDTVDEQTFKHLELEIWKECMYQIEENIAFLFRVIDKNNFKRLENEVRKGLESNISDKNGVTLLHHAASKGHARIVQILLKNGADVSLIDVQGNTALHEAAINGSLSVVKLLLTCGSMYDVRNKKDATPLDLCKNENARSLLISVEQIFYAAKGDPQILERLRNLQSDELKAIWNTRNSQGKTVSQVIIMHGHKDLRQKVLKIIRGEKPDGNIWHILLLIFLVSFIVAMLFVILSPGLIVGQHIINCSASESDRCLKPI